ncbi:MAG: FAD-dependent oxidoreductase [Treponema sp.]
MSKIVIVGANHAGTAAINFLTDLSKDNQVVVFDRNTNISFLGCGMALWIGNQISGSDGLFYSNKEKLEAKGAKVTMEAEITRIDFDKKIVYGTVKGNKIEESYDKLILATGSLPIIPKLKGMELENVQQVKLFQDAQAVIEKLKNPAIKRVAVVGAGYIGVELAEAFQRHNKEVVLIDAMGSSLSNYYDKDFTALMDENLKSHGIQLEYNQMVQEIKGTEKVEAVITDKKELPCDMVVVCIGFRPNTELGKDKIETFKNGAYMVNRNQETSIKDVYAIGDCATVYDNSIGDRSYIALATNAVRSGVVAAHNASGIALESIGVQGSNGINIYDLKMVSTGITQERAQKLGFDVQVTDFEDLQRPEFMEHDNPPVKIRIVYDRKTRAVVGAQMASHYDMSMGIHMFSLAIQEKVTIDKLKLLDIFFLPHFNKPYNYITMAAFSAQ